MVCIFSSLIFLFIHSFANPFINWLGYSFMLPFIKLNVFTQSFIYFSIYFIYFCIALCVHELIYVVFPFQEYEIDQKLNIKVMSRHIIFYLTILLQLPTFINRIKKMVQFIISKSDHTNSLYLIGSR